MNCNLTEDAKQSVALLFNRKDLLYDIENYAFVEGELIEEEKEHIRHQVIDVGQGGNIDRVTRVLDLAHAECAEALYPYTKNKLCCDGYCSDNELDETETYIIRLELPSTFSCTTLKLIKQLVHEYMVCRVLADWMSITNPDKFATWELKTEELKQKIQSSLMSRTGKTRRKLKPF